MDSTESQSESIGLTEIENLVGELRMMARGILKSESNAHSVTPTRLAMSALLRAKVATVDWENVRWENRAHFFASLARAMRHALIDHARRRMASGRGRFEYRSPDEAAFQNLAAEAEERPERILMLEEAVERLEVEDPQLAELIKQYYFLGYSTAEIARFQAVNEKTIDRHLKRARVLLRTLMKS